MVAVAAGAALGQGDALQAGGRRPAGGAHASGSFGYPVKPFHSEHPVRGFFGDPRTVFVGPPTPATLMSGDGNFSFHSGVDICAPNGTAVYPVRSGTVVAAEKREDWHIEIAASDGEWFDYWHVVPLVRVGQRVTAYETVIGHVRSARHVHLSMQVHGMPVNPLAPGRLAPYTDSTAPTVESITMRSAGAGGNVLANFVRGRIQIDAVAFDMPTRPVPGTWRDMPTMPALVTWRIRSWTGKVVVPERTAVDFRTTIPSKAAFWSTYARGTFQNQAVFGSHYSFLQRGEYHVNLSPGSFDTRSLRDGVYDLVVTAKDLRGGSTSRVQRFTIHNRPGWAGS